MIAKSLRDTAVLETRIALFSTVESLAFNHIPGLAD
jgi:hypothetical protein